MAIGSAAGLGLGLYVNPKKPFQHTVNGACAGVCVFAIPVIPYMMVGGPIVYGLGFIVLRCSKAIDRELTDCDKQFNEWLNKDP
jgi:hypothetical protein